MNNKNLIKKYFMMILPLIVLIVLSGVISKEARDNTEDIEYITTETRGNSTVIVIEPESTTEITTEIELETTEEITQESTTKYIPSNTIEVINKTTTTENNMDTESSEESTSRRFNLENMKSNMNCNKTTTKKSTVYYDVPLSYDDQDFVAEVCEYYGFEPKLIYQIIKVESSWNQYCVSSTNDYGLMQLNGRWYSDYLNRDDGYNYVLEDFDIYDVRQNILLGIRELASWRSVCTDRGYYDIVSVLECYNRGYGYFKNTSKTTYSSKVLAVNIYEES